MTLKEKMQSGRKIAGTIILVVRNPALMMIAQNAGLDFLVYDCEHSTYSFETLHDALLMGKALGMDGIVRVPVGTRDYISRALDSGATGIMVPLVETAQQAQDLVKYSKYPPDGKRGFASGCAHTCYQSGKHEEITVEHNSRVVTIAQVETAKAVEDVDAIASVEGLDVIFVGPHDLSVSLGIPGDLMNPIELEAIAKVAAACKKHGKILGMHGDKALLSKFSADLLMCTSAIDTDFLMNGFSGVRALVDSL